MYIQLISLIKLDLLYLLLSKIGSVLVFLGKCKRLKDFLQEGLPWMVKLEVKGEQYMSDVEVISAHCIPISWEFILFLLNANLLF